MGLQDRVGATKNATFTFNCYDAPSGSTAEARLDGGAWRPMTSIKYKSSPVDKPHYFRLVADTALLGSGPHAIEARVVWLDGTVVVEKKTFTVVD